MKNLRRGDVESLNYLSIAIYLKVGICSKVTYIDIIKII